MIQPQPKVYQWSWPSHFQQMPLPVRRYQRVRWFWKYLLSTSARFASTPWTPGGLYPGFEGCGRWWNLWSIRFLPKSLNFSNRGFCCSFMFWTVYLKYLAFWKIVHYYVYLFLHMSSWYVLLPVETLFCSQFSFYL